MSNTMVSWRDEALRLAQLADAQRAEIKRLRAALVTIATIKNRDNYNTVRNAKAFRSAVGIAHAALAEVRS